MNDTPIFGTTRWTQLENERTGDRGDQWLCENYRCAVLSWFRSRFGHHEGEDACQEFFDRVVLRGRLVDRADRTRGSLRGLLRVSLQRFAGRYWRRLRRARLGGGIDSVPADSAGDRLPDGDAMPAEDLFDRIWVAELLERALGEVEKHSEQRGRLPLFQALRPILDGSGPERSHRELANELGLEPRHVTQALFRLRKRIGLCLYRLVVETVRSGGSVDEEWETVRALLRR